MFKREFVKNNNYDKLLPVWDQLWSVYAYEKARQEEAQEEFKRQLNTLKEEDKTTKHVNNETTSDLTNSFSNKLDLDTTLGTSPPYIIQMQGFENKGDFDDSNATNNNNHTANRTSDSEQDEVNQLTNFELFFLSFSLAIIRQERDLIFTQVGCIERHNVCPILLINNFSIQKETRCIWYTKAFQHFEFE